MANLMRDRCSFIIKRFLRTDEKPIEGELVEVMEFDGLPRDFDFTPLVTYLESSEAQDITSFYYSVERRYFHEERGAGGSAEELILQIWNNIPDFIKESLILKIGELVLSMPVKLIKERKSRKISSDERSYLKDKYGFATDVVEEIQIKETDITVKTYKRY